VTYDRLEVASRLILPLDLQTPLTYVKGVGPARAAMLEAKGLTTVEDLIAYTPFRYEDRSNMKPISQLAPGEMATIVAEVRTSKVAGFRRRNLGLFEAQFTDASRDVITGKWFHGAYLADTLIPGRRVALFGKVEFDNSRAVMTRGSRRCTSAVSSPFMKRPAKSTHAYCATCCGRF
jgi:ATP-dependent DNA helicase RecG